MKLTAEQIKEIRERCDESDQHYHYPKINTSTLRAAIEYIAQLEAEVATLREAERWTPVEEYKPEHDMNIPMHKEFHMQFCSVLAVGKYKGCELAKPTVSMVNRIRLKKTGIEYIDKEIKTEEWHWSAPFETVTHWRPLPKPPEAKGE